jgi:hypothetical protein
MKRILLSILFFPVLLACGSSNSNGVITAWVTYQPTGSSDETLLGLGKAGSARIFEMEEPVPAMVEAQSTGQLALAKSSQKVTFKWSGSLPYGLDFGLWSEDGSTFYVGVHCYAQERTGGNVGIGVPVDGGVYLIGTEADGVECWNTASGKLP